MGASSSMMRGKENVSEIVVIHHARRFGFAYVCARRGASRIAHRARGVYAADVDGDASFVVHLPVSVSVSLCGVDVRARARATRMTYATPLGVGRGIHPSMSMSIDVHRCRCRSIDVHRWTTDASNGRTVERSNARGARGVCLCVCLFVCLCV